MKIVLIGRENAALTNDIYNLIAGTGIEVDKLHPDRFLNNEFDPDSSFLITYVTETDRRKLIADKLDAENLHRATFIHPTAMIDPTAIIGDGTFVAPYASVAFESIVGKDCIVAPYSLISHRTNIGRGLVTNPGTMIAGATTVGEYCVFGIRSTTIDGIAICDRVKVGAGSLITKNIEVAGHYVGSPARRVISQ